MPVRATLLLAIALAGCGGPASSASAPLAAAAPAGTADVRELRLEVSELI